MKIYNAAVIGCGNIGGGFDAGPGELPVYTHAGAYSFHQQTRLIAAADVNKNKLSHFARIWGIKKTYRDYTDLFRNETIDIASICTWKDSHYDAIKSAVEHGVKIILCEKPFTGNPSHAKKLVSLCAKKGVTLTVNFTRRYTASHQRVKNIIASGSLGKIQTVNCLYTKGLINNGSHAIDLLTYFFGAPRFVRSLSVIGRRSTAGDHDLSLVLYFHKGFLGTLFACSADHYSLFEIDILGTKGRIKITDSGYDIRWYKVRNSRVFQGYRELGRESILIKNDMGNAMRNALDNAIKGHERTQTLLCSGKDTLATLRTIYAALSSAQENGKKKEI